MIIRNYISTDYFGLLNLLNVVYGSNISKEDLEKFYLTDNRNIIVAINDDSNLIGCAFVEIQCDYVRPNRCVYVTYVAVDEQYRKNGVGRSLMRFIEKFCIENNCNSIELTSANYRLGAHAFYNSLGFTKKDTTLFIKDF